MVSEYKNDWAIRPVGGMFTPSQSDTVDLTVPARGIFVGVSGDVKVTMIDGTVGVWPNLVAGVIHPIEAKRIWVTGTTATGIRCGT